jgi:HTH-type transcriptional repressor of NAD biosynthesis genes
MMQGERPALVRKVCFYGPESTGKSFLAERLADIYQTEFVPEVAKEIITSNNFTVDDIIRIGHEQTARVKEKSRTANKILFCDTDLITTQIYCRHYLGVVPDVLLELEREIQYDRYFLFDTDVPWVSDGMRDLGDRRKEMYEVFRQELVTRDIAYTVVSGSYAEREKLVRTEVNKMLGASV